MMLAEVVDVGGDVVVAAGGGGGEGAGVRDFFHCGETRGNDLVGAVFDPFGGGGVGRAAVGWVVLEAAVLGWVVRGGDDDAVGEVDLASAIVGEDGVRERGCGSVGEVGVDHGVDLVGGEDFECGGEGGFGESVGVLGEKEGAGDVLGGTAAVVADGLSDGCDVVFVEGGVEGTAAMAGGAEGYTLGGDGWIGVEGVVRSDEAREIDQVFWQWVVTGAVGWMGAHALVSLVDRR